VFVYRFSFANVINGNILKNSFKGYPAIREHKAEIVNGSGNILKIGLIKLPSSLFRLAQGKISQYIGIAGICCFFIQKTAENLKILSGSKRSYRLVAKRETKLLRKLP